MKKFMYLMKLILVLSVVLGITGCNKSNDIYKNRFKSGRQGYPAHHVVAPPPPTPADYVRKAMELLVEYRNIFQESMNSANQRMDNRPKDASGVIGGFADIRSLSEAEARYIQNLKSIDISNCPADFQARFNAYVQSEVLILNIASGVTHPDSAEGFFGGMLVMGLAGEQAQKDCNAARNALFELASQKYGVYFN